MLYITECVQGDETEFTVWCYGGGLKEALDILAVLMCILAEERRMRRDIYLEIGTVVVVTC